MLEKVLRDARKALPTQRAWGWDKRYEAALLVTSPDNADPIRRALARILTDTWDESSLGNATQEVRKLALELQRVRPQQELFTKRIDNAQIVFAAYWPWRNNSHVSIRLGVFCVSGSTSAVAAARDLVKATFTEE